MRGPKGDTAVDYPFSGILVRYAARVPEAAQTAAGKTAEPAADPSAMFEATPEPSKAGELLDQLHVNLWEVREKSSRRQRKTSALDLGVMISDWEAVDAVLVDLPWAVGRDDVSDLGSRLNSEKTVAAIFNEIVRYHGCAEENYARISFRSTDPVDQASEDESAFALLRLPGRAYAVNKIPLGHGVSSTQLRIDLPALTELKKIALKKIYLRFRIDCVPRDVYSYVFEQADRNLLSSSLETRIIDFRINVRRGIPDEIFATDKALRFPRFKKIHFFLTINRAQVCDFESKNFVGCRSLVDEAVWNEYLHGPNSGASPDGMKQFLGYQWTESAARHLNGNGRGVKDLVVLGRFSSYNSTVFTAITFLIVGLFFGAIGNGLWDVFKPVAGYWVHLQSKEQTLTISWLTCLLAVGFILVFRHHLIRISKNILRAIFPKSP